MDSDKLITSSSLIQIDLTTNLALQFKKKKLKNKIMIIMLSPYIF